jgi:hypothetical protein
MPGAFFIKQMVWVQRGIYSLLFKERMIQQAQYGFFLIAF